MTFLRRAILFILVFLSIPVFLQAQEDVSEPETEIELSLEEMRQKIYGEAPQELLGFSLGSADVSLFLAGSWKGILQGNIGFFNSPFGTGFTSPEEPPFMQEVDLGLSLWINNRWFVEANFLDDSSRNTYRAGYQGVSGEFLQYAGIGNTGLDFPQFAYLDLGGDSPSSFGLYSRFGGQGLDMHALVRYDAASREERIFYGGRERTYSYLQLYDSIPGVSFVLPDTDIDSEIRVYIENDKGTIRDSGGRRWKLASSSEYAFSGTQGLLELTVRPEGMVAAAYSNKDNSRPWNSSMGAYKTGGYLNTVQQWFDSADLEIYPQCGGGSLRPGEVTFGNITALVIREPGTFSPFERQNRYDAPSSSSESAALVRLSSGEEIGGFELVRLDTSASQTEVPLFTAAVSQKNVYALLQSGGGGQREPASLWPLAKLHPESYLPGRKAFTGDLVLRFTNFREGGGFFIGTDVVPDSIQVWRSGILENDFYYNSSSGEVTFGKNAARNELIRITYLKVSEQAQFGSIAAGLGAVYRKGESPFSIQAAAGIRWNLAEEAFTQEDQSSAGTVGISAKTAWDYDYLKAHIAGGFTFEQTDTTGLYRAAGMEGNETILYLPPEGSFISHPPGTMPPLTAANRADLVYRNYYENTILGSSLMNIGWNAPVVYGINRPYPVKDPQLGDTQVLAAEFSLDSGEWTGFQVPLDNFSFILSQACEIEIPYRFYDFSGEAKNFKLIVQIGALSGEDSAVSENVNLIWEKVLFADDGTLFDSGAYYSDKDFNYNLKTARFPLSDEDNRKLSDAKYMRIITVYDGAFEITGRVLIAPPIVRGAAFRAVTFSGGTVRGSSGFISHKNRVTAVETMDNSLGSAYGSIINRLHPSEDSTGNAQRVLKIEWDDMENFFSAGADGRTGELPLENYRELSFFVKGPSEAVKGDFSFYVTSGPDSIFNSVLEAHLPLSALKAQEWSKVTVRYQGGGTGVFVDGGKAENSRFHYRKQTGRSGDSSPGTNYILFLANPPEGQPLEKGSISIDEIILEDSYLVYRINAGGAAEYSKPGTLLSIGAVPVLEDLTVSNAVESEMRAGSEPEDTQFSGSVVNRTTAQVSLLGVNLNGSFAFTAAEESFMWNAGHGISRTLGLFSLSEEFYASPYNSEAYHNLTFSFLSDFTAKFDADALYEFSKLRQKWQLAFGFTPSNILIPAFSFNNEAAWTSPDKIEEEETYGDIWLRSWKPLVPDTGKDADLRNLKTQIVIMERTKPVGAVLTMEGLLSFSGANSLTQSDSSFFLDIPVVFTKTALNFKAGRAFKKRLYFSGADAAEDGGKFFESIHDFLPFWGVFPGYSLFAPELQDAMDKSLENSPSREISQYTAFTDHFSTNLSLPPVYDLSSFVIPAGITLRLERVLEKKMDTSADIFNLGGGLKFSSVNMFGRLGAKPVFKFYQSDEFTHSFEAAAIFPREEEVSWRIKSVYGAGFRGFSGSELKFANTFALYSDDHWQESVVLDWTAPTKKSLISVIYGWIASAAVKQSSWLKISSLLNSKYEQLRRESLELVFDKTSDHLRWNTILGHEELVRIEGRLEFCAFLKLKLSEDLYTEIFTFNALAGTSLRISF